MKKLRILIFNHNVEWRGTFQRCYDFARLLVESGHEPTIVTNAPEEKFRFEKCAYDQIQIIRSPDLFWGILRSGWDPVNVFRRYRYFKNERFDLIHAFDNRPTVILPALWLSRKWKCPLVSDWCDWWGRGGAIKLRKNKILNFLFEPIETYFEEHYRQYADFLTVISTPLYERAVNLGFPKEKIELVPPLADVKKIFPQNKKKIREKLGVNQYSHILIFSGFVLYDLQVVLEAFPRVLKTYPNCLLILTGGVPARLLRDCSNLPIKNFGFLSNEELNDCLAASDLCLLPLSDCLTNRARYPYKIGRYLAAGRPIVSNPVGDAGRLIKEEEVGILTDDTPESFARGICEALSDPRKLDAMGFRARQIAETRFSGPAFLDKFKRIYFDRFSK